MANGVYFYKEEDADPYQILFGDPFGENASQVAMGEECCCWDWGLCACCIDGTAPDYPSEAYFTVEGWAPCCNWYPPPTGWQCNCGESDPSDAASPCLTTANGTKVAERRGASGTACAWDYDETGLCSPGGLYIEYTASPAWYDSPNGNTCPEAEDEIITIFLRVTIQNCAVLFRSLSDGVPTIIKSSNPYTPNRWLADCRDLFNEVHDFEIITVGGPVGGCYGIDDRDPGMYTGTGTGSAELGTGTEPTACTPWCRWPEPYIMASWI